MKAIQITMEERLLARLDAEDEVKKEGRSAVFRRAIQDYLKRKRDERIAAQYRKAYSKNRPTDADDWESEAVWLDE